MGKSKKGLKRRINPEKSNKMIYAVSGGLFIIFAILLLVTGRGNSSGDKGAIMKNTLSYIKKTDGVISVKFFPDSNSVQIIYDPDPNRRSVIDYKKIAVFAGTKLSFKLKKEVVIVQLIKKKGDKTILRISVKDGIILDKYVTE